MIRKNGCRFSEKVMPEQKDKGETMIRKEVITL